MTGSVSFDHAADTYDATRAERAHVAQAMTEALVAALAGAGAECVLEIGIGTGRIARPLAERGVRVTGADIAPRMLAKLRAQLGSRHLPPDVLLADATALPFAPASFPAVLMVHVLHLVSSAEAALHELRRVLGPGGVFLHPVTHYPGDNPWTAWSEARPEMLRAFGVSPRTRPKPEEINEMLRGLGASLRSTAFAEEEERTTPAFWLERTRQRIDSWTWEVPDDVWPAFFERCEQWNREHFGDLEREFVQPVVYELEVWRFP